VCVCVCVCVGKKQRTRSFLEIGIVAVFVAGCFSCGEAGEKGKKSRTGSWRGACGEKRGQWKEGSVA
jgi:hypothetical protein